MSQPGSIAEYLSELNLCLRARPSRRRRILAEVEDHLLEKAARLRAEGVSDAEAEGAAVAAFGAPEVVAYSFGTDLVASMENRLNEVVGRLDVWMARRPWGGAIVSVAPWTALCAVVTMAGAVTGVRRASAGLIPLTWLGGAFLWRAWRARALRARPEPGIRGRIAAAQASSPQHWWSPSAPPGLFVGTSAAGLVPVSLNALMTYDAMTRVEPEFSGWTLVRSFTGYAVGLLLVGAFIGTTAARQRWRRDRGRRPRGPADADPAWTSVGMTEQASEAAAAGLAVLSAVLAVVAPDFEAPLSFRGFLVVLTLGLIGAFIVGQGGVTSGQRRAVQRHLLSRARLGHQVESPPETGSREARRHGSRRRADPHGEAAALMHLADSYAEEELWDEAAACAEQALELSRTVRHGRGEAEALRLLGYLFIHREGRGHLKRAVSYLDKSAAAYRELGDSAGRAAALTDLAVAYGRQRSWDQAVACAEKALEMYRALGEGPGEAWALYIFGWVWRVRGDVGRAAAFYESSIEAFGRFGDAYHQAAVLLSLAEAYMEQRRWEDAIAASEQSLELSRSVGAKREEAGACALLGRAYGLLGDGQRAEQHWRQALVLFERLGDPAAEQARTWLAAGA